MHDMTCKRESHPLQDIVASNELSKVEVSRRIPREDILEPRKSTYVCVPAFGERVISLIRLGPTARPVETNRLTVSG